jgi:hypothetical protein
MQTRRLLFAQFFAVLLLAALTQIAIAEYLYWRIWWFDIPMHVLGGFWAGLFGAWMLRIFGLEVSMLRCMLFALAVGVVWEVFEYYSGLTDFMYISYSADVAKDLVMDVIGGALSVFAVRLVRGE